MSASSQRSPFSPLLFLYFFSGVIAIAFGVLWSRYLSLQFGVSIFGVVITVAAFMFGLGAGSLLVSLRQLGWRRPLVMFAAMEGLVASFALMMPGVFRFISGSLEGLASMELGAWYALQLVMSLLVLTLPAMAMGCGFPLVVRAAGNNTRSLAWLYGVNALGGVLGAMLPLLLLPRLGWLSANQAVAMLGAVVAIGAYLLSRNTGVQHGVTAAAEKNALPGSDLIFYACIGALALALEIAWSRLLGMVMLRTEYVLAIILAVYLVGIGAGSVLSRFMRGDGWFRLLPLLASVSALASLWWLPHFSAWVERTPFTSLSYAMLAQGGLLALLLLPVTLALGAWLPLLTRRLQGDGRTGTALYGANAMGSGIGVLLTGFLFIPLLGSGVVIVASSVLLTVVALVWDRNKWLMAAPVGLVLLALPVAHLPAVASLLPLALGSSEDLSLYEDAVSITHVVEQPDGQRYLLSDLQRMDASSDPEAVVLQRNQARLGLLLHPQPQSVLFMGLGTGITSSVMAAYPEAQGVAVELSAGAVRAARDSFAALNGGLRGNMEVVRDDVRHFLMANERLFDVILGDLFHPDMVGRGALLTRQHFVRVRRSLSAQGVFVQWLSLNQFDLSSFKTVLASFRDVFPDGMLWVDGFRVALVAAPAGIDAAENARSVAALAPQDSVMLTGGEGFSTWMGRYWGRIPELSEPVQDEWAPVLEYQLPKARFAGRLDVVSITGWLLSLRPSQDAARAQLRIGEDQAQEFVSAYQATTLAYEAWGHILQGRHQQGYAQLRQAWQSNTRDRWLGDALANSLWDQLQQARRQGGSAEQLFGRSEDEVLAAILRMAPGHVGGLKALWERARRAGNADRAAEYLQRLRLLAPLDRDVAASLTD